MKWLMLVGLMILLSVSCGDDATCPEGDRIACGCDDVQRPGVDPRAMPPCIVIDCVVSGKGYTPDGCITGRAFTVTPLENCRVVVYASTENFLVIQPWPGETLPIESDGTWWGRVAGAEVFVAMLVSKDFGPEADLMYLPYKYDGGPVLDYRGYVALPRTWPSEYEDAEIVPGVKIAGLCLGDSMAKVCRILGSPARVYAPVGGRYSLVWTSTGIDVTGFSAIRPKGRKEEPISEDDPVIRLRALTPYAGTTLAGNGVGSSPDSFVEELGQPTRAYSDLDDDLVHVWAQDGLKVIYRDSLATNVIVTCPTD